MCGCKAIVIIELASVGHTEYLYADYCFYSDASVNDQLQGSSPEIFSIYHFGETIDEANFNTRAA